MKTILKRTVALMLSLLMVFSVCSTAFVVYASNATEFIKPLVYVSIGDSMTNGYGMEGYDGSSGIVNYANDTYANKFAAYLAGYAGSIANDQVIFSGTNGVVDHRQLAMSGLRAEDLHWALELDYKNEALIQKLWEYQCDGNSWEDISSKWYGELGFKTGDYRTWTDMVDSDYRYADGAARILNTYYNNPVNAQFYQSAYANSVNLAAIGNGIARDPYFPQGSSDKSVLGSAYLQIATEFFQESIKDADVISLALGNTNFGTYMLTEIIEAVNGDFNRFPGRYDIENIYALANLEPDLEIKVRGLVDECSVLIDQVFGTLSGSDPRKKEALKNIITYCIASYTVNYVGVINDILTINEKESVDIIQVALMNAYASEGAEVGVEGTTLGDIVTLLYKPMNAFIAALPTYMQATGNALYQKAEFYYSEAETVESMVAVYGHDFYKDKVTGEYIPYPGWNFDPSTMEANLDSIVRERFVEEGDGIVKGTTFGALAGVVKSKYGIDLRRDLTVEEVAAYEAMSPAQKAGFAVSDPATAMSIAFYLAFENATIKAGTGTVTLEALVASGNALGAFGDVMTVFGNTITAAAASYANPAAAALAVAFNMGMSGYGLTANLTAENILAIYAGYATAEQIAEGYIFPANATVIEMLAKDGLAKVAFTSGLLAAAGFTGTEEDWNLMPAQQKAQITEIAWTYASADQKQLATDTAKATITNALKSAVSNVPNICMMLAIPVTLSDAMIGNEAKGIARNDTVCGLLCMNARVIIGTGIGGHPSPNGHNAVYESMKLSYETGYTSQDKTIDNIIYIITEYSDEAYMMIDAMSVKNADYIINKNSSYVAFGDNKAYTDMFAGYLGDCVTTANFGFSYKSNTDLVVPGSTIGTLPLLLTANAESVATADLISIGYSLDKITEDTMNILFDLIGTGETPINTTFDWAALLGAEGAAKVTDVLTSVKAELDAQGMNQTLNQMLLPILKSKVTISEAVVSAMEYFAYYALEYATVLPAAVSAIRAINPDALIMINSMSNPAAGAGISFAGMEFMFGDYLDKFVSIAYIEAAALTIMNENVVLVPATDTETSFTNTTINENNLKDYLLVLLGKKDLEITSTEAGNANIFAKMVAALNVSVTDTIVLPGDIDGNGVVDSDDAIYLLMYTIFPSDYPIAQDADMNGNGTVDSDDAIYLLMYTIFPSDYPLN